jgi:hypothetical protein
VAQRNINIVKVSAREGGMRITVRTVNPNDKLAQVATLRVVADPQPDKRVLEILNPGLKGTGVFRRVATARPKGFSLSFPDFPSPKVRDHARPRGCLYGLFGGGRYAAPTYEADVQLKPGQVTSFDFVADVSSGQPGDAFIFYLTHLRPDKQEIGGITLVGVLS